MAKRDLMSDVLATAKTVRPGPSTWAQRLPDDLRAELDEIRVAFHAGKVPVTKNSLCRAIKSQVEARGHWCVNVAGVVRWLDGN